MFSMFIDWRTSIYFDCLTLKKLVQIAEIYHKILQIHSNCGKNIIPIDIDFTICFIVRQKWYPLFRICNFKFFYSLHFKYLNKLYLQCKYQANYQTSTNTVVALLTKSSIIWVMKVLKI